MLWRAELERGSLPILLTKKNQLWSLTCLFGGKLNLAKQKKDWEKHTASLMRAMGWGSLPCLEKASFFLSVSLVFLHQLIH